uniref:ShKT domain-containing protein n=1 Tax=Angiostrongylus cantonensis TaxID=6313 RepID=A0A0K0DNI7_ANGCA
LNLRRCLGALMQLRNCPAVLPDPVQSGPMKSVRSVIDVPRIPDYDDTDGTLHRKLFLVSNVVIIFKKFSGDQFAVRPTPSTVQPEAVWSSWQGVCQHFVSAQPCNNGEMIGFESRECIARDPSLCEGPFFRYCTLPC